MSRSSRTQSNSEDEILRRSVQELQGLIPRENWESLGVSTFANEATLEAFNAWTAAAERYATSLETAPHKFSELTSNPSLLTSALTAFTQNPSNPQPLVQFPTTSTTEFAKGSLPSIVDRVREKVPPCVSNFSETINEFEPVYGKIERENPVLEDQIREKRQKIEQTKVKQGKSTRERSDLTRSWHQLQATRNGEEEKQRNQLQMAAERMKQRINGIDVIQQSEKSDLIKGFEEMDKEE
jgi:hypothetical protein